MRPTSPRSIVDAMGDVFGSTFAGPSWDAWRAFLRAVFALPMSDSDAATVRTCTGRQTLPTSPARQAWMVIGRRGGKSRIAALLAVYFAAFRRYVLAPGERGVVMIIAADRRQARVVFRYVRSLFESVPMLQALVEHTTADALHLSNGISIEIHTASFKTVRGYTVVAAILDEIAFWPTEDAAAPDREIVAALLPSMATIPGAMLVALSSPHARKGELWRAYHEHFGVDDDGTFVWQADTRTMNPVVDEGLIARAYLDDEAAASAEYGAQFRRDLEDYASREVVDAAVVPDRLIVPPMADVRYHAFADPSGGSSDSMTLAIGHQGRDGRFVLDRVEEAKAPFDPTVITEQFCAVLKTYGLRRVTGDYYGGEWPSAQFRLRGVTYTTCESSKSDLYAELLPMLNGGRVELLDLPTLRTQLLGLERRTARSGKTSIDHAPRKRDDVVNAVAGVLVTLETTLRRNAAPLVGIVRSDYGTRGRSAKDFSERVGDRLLADELATRRSLPTEDDRLRELVRSAQPVRDPLAGLKAYCAEHGRERTVAMMRQVNGADTALPEFLRETTGPRRG